MKRLLIIAAAISLLTSSCITRKQCDERCASKSPVLSDSVSTNTKTNITKRDTDVVEPEKDGPNVVINLGDNCDSIKARLKYLEEHPKVVEKNGIKATTKYDSATKSLETDIHEDAHKIHLAHALTTIEVYKEWTDKLTKLVYCNKKHLEPWHINCIWGFFILLALVVGYIVLRFGKWIKSLPFP